MGQRNGMVGRLINGVGINATISASSIKGLDGENTFENETGFIK